MTSAIPSGDQRPDRPVCSATEFTGRARLAQNLLSRCLRRQSIHLYGGPKLGKTSMLLQLKWLAEQERGVASVTPEAVYLNLTDDDSRHALLSGRRSNPAAVLLLDNCDALLNDKCVDGLREFMQNETIGHAIVWAGGRSWHDWVQAQLGTGNLQPAPLAVLLHGEACELLKPHLAPHDVDTALAAGGTHPYVLKMVVDALLSCSADPERAISTASKRLVPFFQICRESLQQPAERTLLQYLVKAARPVNPGDAARAVGVPTVKSSADVLCYLGLISRWNLTEGAMLQANCRLFNDWYLTGC